MFILYFGIFHWNIIKQFSHVSGLRFLLILIFTPFNSVLPFSICKTALPNFCLLWIARMTNSFYIFNGDFSHIFKCL